MSEPSPAKEAEETAEEATSREPKPRRFDEIRDNVYLCEDSDLPKVYRSSKSIVSAREVYSVYVQGVALRHVQLSGPCHNGRVRRQVRLRKDLQKPTLPAGAPIFSHSNVAVFFRKSMPTWRFSILAPRALV